MQTPVNNPARPIKVGAKLSNQPETRLVPPADFMSRSMLHGPMRHAPPKLLRLSECSASDGADTSAASLLTRSTFCSIVCASSVSPEFVQPLCLQHRLDHALDAGLDQETAHTRTPAKSCVPKFNLRTSNW